MKTLVTYNYKIVPWFCLFFSEKLKIKENAIAVQEYCKKETLLPKIVL